MKYLLKILTLYLILFEVIIISGQNSTVFQKIDQQNGLSNSRITEIIKEKNGFIWISNQNGLNRFDGHSFKVYQKRNSKIGSNDISDIILDSKNRIWLATLGGGLNFYDREKDDFIVYNNKIESSNTSVSNHINTIIEDKNETIWLATELGLVHFNLLNNTFKNRWAKKSLIPFPIDSTIQHLSSREEILNENGWLLKGEFHILNIGLWTPGKNQSYAIELARALYEKYGWTYIFHFLGNQAPNFKDYWEPIMQNLPPNVFVLGERDDVLKYFKMADLMLFTSNFECNPIVLKEAISNNIKIMAYNLEHYGEEYSPFINPLSGDIERDKLGILETIHSPIKYKLEDYKDNVQQFAFQHTKFYQSLNG